ncbi:MAG TPA: RICIN domain-containing protein [Acidobacteriaceae bacterium]|jgi:arabinogalactan endo-1,4-beta-galactosidase|nr:RICIN domain-containing protein [Acidobacteriaceae bacterium]
MPSIALSQQPTEPVDPTPLDGETYYFINQLSGLQMDLNAGSTASEDSILQEPASYTSLSQRWATTKMPDGNWKISNIANGLCLDSATSADVTATVQNPCSVGASSQEWSFTYTSNGYNVMVNAASGDALDVTGRSSAAGATLNQTPVTATPTQSQQWLFRPVFFRGEDNALLEKEEELRVDGDQPWWQDAGQMDDVLHMMKAHGFNLLRIRPTSVPPYTTYTLGTQAAIPATCSANGCYAEADAADLDLAKRAKQLGMAVELSLFFDGGSSSAAPGSWDGYTVAQTQTAIYNYVKAEVESYRAEGVMPDMVSVGNEVDTGFLASLGGSPSGPANSAAFLNFAAYEMAGLQAVSDAASDTTLGPVIPAPIRCIHITPAWDLTSFFSEVNTDNVPYDAICQSYYPFLHGPLTAAQASSSNPNHQPVEQNALTSAANSIGKPIFVIETAEHYENGFDSNDPWYPATRAGQRQFVLDLESVLKTLPNNLGMGFDYWDGTGTDIPNGSGFTAGDGKTDATFAWNGLTLFDNADSSGSSSASAPTYDAVLPALSAVGGTIDASLAYKLVNAADGTLLESAAALTTSGARLDTGVDPGVISAHQEWRIMSNNDGYFQIASLNPATPVNVLDSQGNTAAGSAVVQASASSGTANQEWDIVSAGSGYFTVVNKESGLVVATSPGGSGSADAIVQQTPTSSNADWITPASKNQMWRIVPVHISVPSTPSELAFGSSTPTSIGLGGSLGTVSVSVEDSAGALTGNVAVPVTLAVMGPGGFSDTTEAASADGVATFDLASVSLTTPGSYTLTASSPGLTSATAGLTVSALAATQVVLTASASSVMTGTAVMFTATVSRISGTSQPTGSVTFLDGTTTLGNVALSAGVATYTTSTLAVGTHNITAEYTGDSSDATSTSAATQVIVSPAPDFSLSVSPGSATISAGSSTNTTVTVTPTGVFSASVSLACSGLPAYATCTFAPASVTPNGAAATAVMTIETDVNVTEGFVIKGERTRPGGGGGARAALASVSLLVLLIWPGFAGRKRKRVILRSLGMVVLAFAVSQVLSGCGGSSAGSTGPTSPKTPVGESTITITATSGTLTHAATFQLTVQ